MSGSKPWWQSKSIWNGVVIVLIGAYGTTAVQFPQLHLPAIPDFVIGILGAFGIATRATASKVIG